MVEALIGRFDDTTSTMARMLLDQIDALSGQITKLTTRIEELIAAIPAAQRVDAAEVILAELGLDMGQFPTPPTWCRGPSCTHVPSSPG